MKRFQRRHGLEPDGVVGAAAVAQMNVSVDERIRQLTLNLERWRWLPRDLGERYILVNIPEYQLEVWDHGQVPLAMRVVVGKKDTPTPIFSDDMTHLVFHPTGTSPPTSPRKRRCRRSCAIRSSCSGRTWRSSTGAGTRSTRQRSIWRTGAGIGSASARSSNSLGLVKFMFPNEFNVYLHDTPAGALFARAKRSFSHGCVRLAEPDKLARYVLGDQPDWTPERIDEAMHSGQERTVKLSRPLPVYLGYWTARVSADGLVRFSDDIYGVDARQTTMIVRTVEKLRARASAAASSGEATTTLTEKF